MARRIGRRKVLTVGGAIAMALVLIGAVTSAMSGGGSDEAAENRLQLDSGAALSAGAETSNGFSGPPVAEGAASTRSAPAGAGGTAAGDAQVAPQLPAIGAPSVVRTATLEVEVTDGRFAAAFAKVSLVASGHGGFVASSTSSTAVPEEDRGGGGSLVLRVPADRFDVVRQELAKLGDLRSEELHGADVSGQLTDLDARLRNLRAQEDALRLLMTKTTNVGETIEVQRQLSGVREQIERLSAEQARVQDAVAMSTISVSIVEPGASFGTDPGQPSIVDAFGRASEGAERVVTGVIVALGYLLPLAVLGLVVWLAARMVLRLRPPAPAAVRAD